METPRENADLCASPSQSKRCLVGKQLAKAQHHAVDKGKQQIDGSALEYRPYRRGLVKDDWRAGRRRRLGRVAHVGVLLAIRVHRDAGLGERRGVVER